MRTTKSTGPGRADDDLATRPPSDQDFRVAHAPTAVGRHRSAFDRPERERWERSELADGATVASGAGDRLTPEAPDPLRTCFERDRDRIVHSPPFRRLAGKTQVFIFPSDHQRTRLTHALEVAQVAASVARATHLNVALTEAIALGHDCGHGPVGHASEDAFAPYLPGGFQHAQWGADVALRALNLCAETLDGVRNHSWCRPAPATPEGEVVAWADRIAYLCHDFEDAVHAGILTPRELPAAVSVALGSTRSDRIDVLVTALVRTIIEDGVVAMPAGQADALAEWRAFNYERIYLRPEARTEAARVVGLLRALVEHYAQRPRLLIGRIASDVALETDPSTTESYRTAVEYVAGMTDRYAFGTAMRELDWPSTDLPRGIDVIVADR